MENIPPDKIITYAYVTSTVFFLLAAALLYIIYIYSKRQTIYHKNIEDIRKKNEASLLKSTLTAQEKERERIGANLHDDIGPLLSSFKMYFKNELGSRNREDKEEVQSILVALDENIEQVRDFSRDLVPNVLYQFGLKESLEELKRRIEKTSDIHINLQITEELFLEIEDALSVYRIVQESITNGLRHGNADVIDVSMIEIDHAYTLKISDNGDGFDTEKNHIGLGLRNIEARSKSMVADFKIESLIGKGTSIFIVGIKKLTSD